MAWKLVESGPGSVWVVGWAAAVVSRSAEALAMVEVKGSAAAWPLAEESAPVAESVTWLNGVDAGCEVGVCWTADAGCGVGCGPGVAVG